MELLNHLIDACYTRLVLPGDAGLDLEGFMTLVGLLLEHATAERPEEVDVFDVVDVDGDE